MPPIPPNRPAALAPGNRARHNPAATPSHQQPPHKDHQHPRHPPNHRRNPHRIHPQHHHRTPQPRSPCRIRCFPSRLRTPQNLGIRNPETGTQRHHPRHRIRPPLPPQQHHDHPQHPRHRPAQILTPPCSYTCIKTWQSERGTLPTSTNTTPTSSSFLRPHPAPPAPCQLPPSAVTAQCNDCTLLSLHNAITTHQGSTPLRSPPRPRVNHPLTPPRIPPTHSQSPTPHYPLPFLSYPRVDCHTRTPARIPPPLPAPPQPAHRQHDAVNAICYHSTPQSPLLLPPHPAPTAPPRARCLAPLAELVTTPLRSLQPPLTPPHHPRFSYPGVNQTQRAHHPAVEHRHPLVSRLTPPATLLPPPAPLTGLRPPTSTPSTPTTARARPPLLPHHQQRGSATP